MAVTEALPQLSGVVPYSLSFWISVTILAILDSLNPCMISLLLIMLANLAALGLERKDLAVRATIFTLICFLTYLFIGVLIYLGYSYLFALAIAVEGLTYLKAFLVALLLIVGTINIYDGLTGRKPVFAVPEKAKKTLENLMKYVSIAATVMLAVFTTLVELPCTGIFYLGLIAYIHSFTGSLLAALPVLIYYNILFVLPEILITLAVWKGESMQELYSYYRAKRRVLRFVEGVVLYLLAVFVWLFVGVG